MRLLSHFLLGFGLLCAMAAPAEAVSYSTLFVFGDSLVDSGNANAQTSNAAASSLFGYANGRFSNGPNFADDLAVKLDLPVSGIALTGAGPNFAVGGSTAESSADPGNFSFNKQVGFLQTFGGAFIPANALVLVTFGGNDVRDTVGSPTYDFTQAGTDLLAGLNALYGMGARNFLITGSPDIGKLPETFAKLGGNPIALDEISQRSVEMSNVIETQSDALAALYGDASVTYFDLYGYEQRLLADPAGFGLQSTLNTTSPCWNPANPALANCSNSLYFDPIHPTALIHNAIANALIGTLDVPEPATWLMMIVGFGAVGFAMRRDRAFVIFARRG